MALLDYRKLCPNSGRPLSADEREVLRARESVTGKTGEIRCGACNRTVKACLDPGTRMFLVHPMHIRSEA